MNKVMLRVNKAIWRLATRLTYAKHILFVVNTYAWAGNPESLSRFAPAHCYISRIFGKIALIAALAVCTVYFGQKYLFIQAGDLKLLELSLSLFPNILGFGIGAYALLFTFPRSFFDNLESRKTESKAQIGAHGLNAITAFPLLAIASIILLSMLTNIMELPLIASNAAGFFFVVYGMMLTIEVIGVLFASARKVIRQSRLTNSETTNIDV